MTWSLYPWLGIVQSMANEMALDWAISGHSMNMNWEPNLKDDSALYSSYGT